MRFSVEWDGSLKSLAAFTVCSNCVKLTHWLLAQIDKYTTLFIKCFLDYSFCGNSFEFRINESYTNWCKVENIKNRRKYQSFIQKLQNIHLLFTFNFLKIMSIYIPIYMIIIMFAFRFLFWLQRHLDPKGGNRAWQFALSTQAS